MAAGYFDLLSFLCGWFVSASEYVAVDTYPGDTAWSQSGVGSVTVTQSGVAGCTFSRKTSS